MNIIKSALCGLCLSTALVHSSTQLKEFGKCRASMHAAQLQEALHVVDKLHKEGILPLATENSLEDFLDTFIFLDDAQKAHIRVRILEYYKSANKNVDFKSHVPTYPEQRALSLALGFVHNPVDLWKKMGEVPATDLLETFLKERNSAYSKEQIFKVVEIIRSKLQNPSQTAVIFGSFPNGLAKPGISDIDVAWDYTHSPKQVVINHGQSLATEDPLLKSLKFSLSHYDSDNLLLVARISRVMIEVHQSHCVLLIYPASLAQDGMGNYVATEPIRLPLNY